MKIGDPPKTTRLTPAGRAATDGKAKGTAFAAPVDEIVLLGVPESELTPRVRAALMSLLADVQKLRDDLAHAQSRLGELEKIADRDPLLDVLNRRAFARELDRALAMRNRYDIRASLVFIDVNDLKKLNDSLGHGAGDAALGHVAAVLSSNIRQTDTVGRLGGDEFGMLLMQSDQATAEKKAAELAALVSAKPIKWKEHSVKVNISWGAVEIGKDLSADQAMEYADSAMYAAKRRK